MQEIWTECYFSKDYEVSNLGNIKSLHSGELLHPCIVQKTYQVTLKINKKSKHCKVHRLILLSFDPEFDNGVVKFKNNDPLDVRLDNLEYNKIIKIDNEIWKPCLITPNYEVSNIGRVKNIKSGRILIARLNNKGYNHIELVTQSKGNINTTITIHRLVMQAFKQDLYFEGAHINHINGIKTDNRVENLEWCTQQENNKHAVEMGLREIKIGEESNSSKLTESQVLEIRKLYPDIKNYVKLGKQFGVSDNTIKKIVLRKTWNHI